MDKIRITKIRPVTWKVYMQGLEQAQYVRSVVRNAGLDAGNPSPEPGLTEPPLYSIEVTSPEDVTLIAEELETLLSKDERVQLWTESSN